MTIEELGSLGEIIGALATIGTLLYLAIQIRANTIAMRAEARRTHYAVNRENNALVSSSDEVASMLLRGLSDPKSLTPSEQIRFTFLMASFVNNAELGFNEHRQKVIDDWEMKRAVLATARLLRTPGGEWFWARHGRNYRGPFVDYTMNIDLSDYET